MVDIEYNSRYVVEKWRSLMVEAPRCCRPRPRTSLSYGQYWTGSSADHGDSGHGNGLETDLNHYDPRGLMFTFYGSHYTLSSHNSSSLSRGYVCTNLPLT